ncbi:MAG: heterodisulfide reductase-related iron-sulfur binding cluster [Candidatus Hydrothermarchaeaceae archaeon]
MAKEKLKTLPVYWGCTFTHNFPFLINSTRMMFNELGIQPVDIEDAGCCPDPVYLKTYGDNLNLALSARNLALAEKKGQEFLVPCNGCYNVLEGAHTKLKDLNLRARINDFLPEGMKYHGDTQPIHILQLLQSNLPGIKESVKNPLDLKVAVHYGCHSLYPHPAVASDNPENPSSLDAIVEATGAKSIGYEGKLDCCGVGVVAFDIKESNNILADKLNNVRGKADCIVTACPACFLRLDAPPQPLKELSTPVIHISELLCLAFGISPEKLFFEGHMTDVSPVIEGLKPSSEGLALVKKHFDYGLLSHHCGACRKECTAAVKSRDTESPFDPLKVVDDLLSGNFYEVLESKEIWRCLQCGKCEERCPNNCGLTELFVKLRELANAHEKPPRVIADKLTTLQKTGYGVSKRVGIRKKMGIDPAPEIDATIIAKIIEKTKKEAENAS